MYYQSKLRNSTFICGLTICELWFYDFVSMTFFKFFFIYHILQEISEIHHGLDLHLHLFLHPPTLPLSPTLHLSYPAPPLKDRCGGFALVRVPPPPDPTGRCYRDLLWTHACHTGRRPELCHCRRAYAAPAWRSNQGLLPQRQHAVERIWSVPGHPHPLPVLPAFIGGTVCLWPPCSPEKTPGGISRSTPKIGLPLQCISSLCAAVPFIMYAGILSKAPLPAVRGSSGLPGLERTLPGMVQVCTQMVFCLFAKRWTLTLYRHWQTLNFDKEMCWEW